MNIAFTNNHDGQYWVHERDTNKHIGYLSPRGSPTQTADVCAGFQLPSLSTMDYFDERESLALNNRLASATPNSAQRAVQHKFDNLAPEEGKMNPKLKITRRGQRFPHDSLRSDQVVSYTVSYGGRTLGTCWDFGDCAQFGNDLGRYLPDKGSSRFSDFEQLRSYLHKHIDGSIKCHNL